MQGFSVIKDMCIRIYIHLAEAGSKHLTVIIYAPVPKSTPKSIKKEGL